MNVSKKIFWLPFVLLILVSAIAYLPNIQHFTYYRDDWYYMLDGVMGGAKIFHEMFQSDRPIRGYIFEWLFTLFGPYPLPYHGLAYAWRVLSGLAAYWLFKLLWKGDDKPAFWGALLFTLFPGYLWWVAGVEYQPMILSVFLQVVSIALTLQSVLSPTKGARILLALGAILTGWLYMALVDYAIGMEVFRILCVYVVINRDAESRTRIEKVIETVRAWAVHALIPLGFLFWRLFIFQNTRSATDVGGQLSELLRAPILTGSWWGIRWLQSTLNVAILAWGAPFSSLFFEQRLRDILSALALLLIALAIIIFAQRFSTRWENAKPGTPLTRWQEQAIWIGLAGTFAGVLPIILANREVAFNAYSHYALPASLAGVTFLIGLIFSYPNKRVQFALFLALTSVGLLTHRANAMNAVNEEQAIAQFWWQVAWRVPQLEEGTTLLINYPEFSYGEETDIAWGPANFIYGLETGLESPIHYKFSALSLKSKDVFDILNGKKPLSSISRSHQFEIYYDKILVMSQPWAGSCANILDANQLKYSYQENPSIVLAGVKSQTQNILQAQHPLLPPEFVFGAEPPHSWCYYYEKAELAVQTKNWQAIPPLAQQAKKADLHPNEPVEWIPFLQAYAALGDEANFKATASQIRESTFYRDEACRVLEAMPVQGIEFTAEIQAKIQELFCH